MAAAATAAAATSLQSVIHYWKHFDLPQLQRELDVVATDLANRQDESDTSRRKLVELSKDFKKTTAEDVRQLVAPLLKNFQLEIDQLSKRCKAAEAAFLNVYKKLIDIPDPLPTLDYCERLQQKIQRVQELEAENKQLRDTLNEYNEELKEVKSQDVTIKVLKDRLKELEGKLECAAMLNQKTVNKDRERELEKQLQDRERYLQDTQMTVNKKLEEAELKVNSLQSALEISQSELFDLKSRLDEDCHAKSDEMEIIVTDMERANQRASIAEKEVDQLKEQLSAAHRSLQLADQIQKAPDMEQAISILTRSSLEMELAAKDKEICQLVNEVQQLQTAINQLKETSASQIAQLEEQLELKSNKICKLEAKLSTQGDYEEMRKELEILKSVDLCGVGDGSAAGSEGNAGKPLEMLLAQKAKSLQTENTSLKVINAELQGPTVPPDPGPAGPGPGSGPASSANDSSATTGGSAIAPFISPALQTVETFGSLLGEEIVASWQRSEDVISPLPQDSSPASPQRIGGDSTTNNSSSNNNNNIINNNGGGCGELSDMKCHLSNGSNSVIAGVSLPPSTPTPIITSSSPPTPLVVVKETGLERAALNKLQELLRQNIEKHANDLLNTMNISRRVRELLSIHNIGQRLFAKYILGLSQGTVSELLSKPKPWDKLTEKGRDSYRKMHAWASDDSCVMVLKSLVPRKGKEPGLPSYRAEEMATEERIAMILNEAQQVMKTGLDSSSHLPHQHHFDDRSSNDSETSKRDSPIAMSVKEQYGAAMAAAAMAAAVGGRRVRKYENDDIPQEMVVKIYQEELAKLMGNSMDDVGGESVAAAAAAAALVGIPFSKDQYQRTQDEIRLALNVYHQELSRLTAQQMQNENGVQDLSLPKRDRQKESRRMLTASGEMGHLVNGGCSDGPCEREETRTPLKRSAQGSPVMHQTKSDVSRHSGSAFTLVRPKVEAVEEVNNSVCGTAVSPLQRMQSITNSLISQSPLPNIPTLPQRPLRAVLPPITQQQFDQYTNLNTEDIVKKVKEQLSQFSISQRLFGENVLGLSQGSVSDLLARPKPWHMLTQKGREPFIRMKIFLEDENAVHKLVASQYKIAPEKLMRTGSGYGVSPPHTAGSSKHSQSMKELEQHHKHVERNAYSNSHHHHHPHLHHQSGSPIVHSHHHLQQQQQQHQHQHQQQHHGGSGSGGVTVHQVHLPNLMSCSSPHDLTMSSNTMTTSSTTITPSTTVLDASSPANRRSSAAAAAAAAVYRAVSHLQPSVYEMAALTQDLDTQTITTKIKETLLANNIGQKIFGEAVLGLSQGSVSELLSKPKPWHMLSIKGREPFIRMQLWLSDPHNVDRLQVLKNERREANKRRRGTIDYLEGLESLENTPHTQLHSSGGGSIHHGNGSLIATSPTMGPTPKKPRVLFSEEQKEALRIAFTLDPYPSTATIEFLAQELILTARTITNWFHNHRMRLKQQIPHNNLTLPASPRSNNNNIDEFGSNNNNNSNHNNNNNREGSTFDPTEFRLLLNQRLVEMQKDKGSNSVVSSATTANMMPSTYSFYSNSSSPISGLDLSISSSCHGSLGLRLKREAPDMDQDAESNVETSDYDSDDNNSKDLGYASLRLRPAPTTMIPVPQPQSRTPGLPSSRREAELVNAMMGTQAGRAQAGSGGGTVAGGSSSSRRKPAAPQWVNPGWDTADDEEEEDDVMMEDDDEDEDDFRNDLDHEMEDEDDEDLGPEGNLRRVRLREKDEAEVKSVSDQLERALGRTEEQAHLVDQLENDLLKINSLSIMYRGEGEGQAAPVDAIIYEVSGSYGGSKEVSMSSNAAESLLPIVSSQRERFRQRIQELEIQSSSQQRQFNTLKGEVEKLREDNVKLYEKIRFLQMIFQKEEETEVRYSRQYESSLDPFASFSRRERQTRYWNLSPFERFTLGMGKMILSNKTARIFTFIYVLILHCLVFGVLYKLAYSETWIRDLSSNCAESYAQHMQREHGKTLDRSIIIDHEHRHNN